MVALAPPARGKAPLQPEVRPYEAIAFIGFAGKGAARVEIWEVETPMNAIYRGFDPSFDARILRAAKISSDGAGYDGRARERDIGFPLSIESALSAARRIKAIKDSSDLRIEFTQRSF